MSYKFNWLDMFLIIKIKLTINTLKLNLDKFKMKTVLGKIKYYLGKKDFIRPVYISWFQLFRYIFDN